MRSRNLGLSRDSEKNICFENFENPPLTLKKLCIAVSGELVSKMTPAMIGRNGMGRKKKTEKHWNDQNNRNIDKKMMDIRKIRKRKGVL